MIGCFYSTEVQSGGSVQAKLNSRALLVQAFPAYEYAS